MVRTKFTARKSCIGLRKLWTPRPLVEAETLPVKPETSSEEDPEEISEEGSEENSEEDAEEDEKEDSKRK